MNDSADSIDEDASAPLLTTAASNSRASRRGSLFSGRSKPGRDTADSDDEDLPASQKRGAYGSDSAGGSSEMPKGHPLDTGVSTDNLVTAARVSPRDAPAARGGGGGGGRSLQDPAHGESLESLEMADSVGANGRREGREGGLATAPSAAISARMSQVQDDQEEEEDGGMSQDDVKHGAKQVINLIIPVSICMAIVVATMQSITYYKESGGQTLYYIAFKESDNQSTGEKFGGAIVNVIIIIAVILGMTCLLVILYKYRCYKAIWLWMFLSTCMLQFLFTYTYLLMVLDRYNTPMDWVTFAFVIWNFGVVGVLSIHYKLPLRLQQAYLIITSALLALTLIKYLPDWTTWVLLGAIAIYDLFAVLCPRGPLKVLVETAQERGEPLFPALVYSSTMLWLVGGMADQDEDAPAAPRNPRAPPNRGLSDAERASAAQVQQAPEEEEEEERRGVKLGLGDFIFYSVLVGKAATRDEWSTILACFVAILVGLCLTLLLLAVFRHALPALPISIAFGLIFYFTSRYVLVPFNEQLAIDQVFV
eukprot:Opistho-1_new@99036